MIDFEKIAERVLKTDCARRVKTADYLDWLYRFVEPEQVYSDENALYTMPDGKDKDNILMLSYLQEYVREEAGKQGVPNLPDPDNVFQTHNYLFRHKDRYYQIDTMEGQGAITFISLVPNPPARQAVILSVNDH